jgi:hypothetical protein
MVMLTLLPALRDQLASLGEAARIVLAAIDPSIAAAISARATDPSRRASPDDVGSARDPL